MSESRNTISRRPVLLALAGLSATVATAIAFDRFPLWHKRAVGPYADYVNTLEDAAAAAIVGNVMLQHRKAPKALIDESAAFVRGRLASEKLQKAVATDAGRGYLIEAGGWVLPITAGALCLLATQSV